jgi:hypothetical protein
VVGLKFRVSVFLTSIAVREEEELLASSPNAFNIEMDC